ncbi:hypothetical protein DINM_000651 [Dirofilaria immitis]|nr:hypothetical protein [Dirofilaria immitis]
MGTSNPVDLWKHSLSNTNGLIAGSDVSSTPLFLTSPVISSFTGDANYLRRIFKAWPINMERKAVFLASTCYIYGLRPISMQFAFQEFVSIPILFLGMQIIRTLKHNDCAVRWNFLPMISTPYLTAAAAILQGDQNSIPKLRKTNNWLNYVFRWKVGVNACRGILLPMALGLSAVSGASMYIRLWGRQKIMDTLSVEPGFVAEMGEH